jgi:hypothetical protein
VKDNIDNVKPECALHPEEESIESRISAIKCEKEGERKKRERKTGKLEFKVSSINSPLVNMIKIIKMKSIFHTHIHTHTHLHTQSPSKGTRKCGRALEACIPECECC